MRCGASRRRRLSKHDGTTDSPECNYENPEGKPFFHMGIMSTPQGKFCFRRFGN